MILWYLKFKNIIFIICAVLNHSKNGWIPRACTIVFPPSKSTRTGISVNNRNWRLVRGLNLLAFLGRVTPISPDNNAVVHVCPMDSVAWQVAKYGKPSLYNFLDHRPRELCTERNRGYASVQIVRAWWSGCGCACVCVCVCVILLSFCSAACSCTYTVGRGLRAVILFA